MNSSKKYTAVVIGTGKIGSTFSNLINLPGDHSHAAAYQNNARTELVGLSDTNPNSLEQACNQWGVNGDTDPVKLCLKYKPNIISICTPNETHFELVKIILDKYSPKLLFIEKPLALSAEDAKKIINQAGSVGCAILVNYSRRFDNRYRVLAQELQSGFHGKPLFIHAIYGKGLAHSASHTIDILRLLLGEPESAGKISAFEPIYGLGQDKTESAWMIFKNGCRVVFSAFDCRVATVGDVDLYTEKSKIRILNGGDQWEFYSVKNSPLYDGYQEYLPSNREQNDLIFKQPANSLGSAVQNIVEFLDGKSQLLCTGEDGYQVMRWVEKIRKN